MERPEGSSDVPPGFQEMPPQQESRSEPTPSASASKPAEKKPEPKPEPKDEPMEVDDADATAKKEAEAVKAKGNAAYKARQFDEAIEHYSKAWELYPKDVTFLTNLSGEPRVSRLFRKQTV